MRISALIGMAMRMSVVSAADADTHVHEQGVTLALPGQWAKIAPTQGDALIWRNTAGTSQMTVTAMTARQPLDAEKRKATVSRLLELRRTAEQRADATVKNGEPIAIEDSGIYGVTYQGTEANGQMRIATKIVCSAKGCSVFFLESEERSEQAFARTVTQIMTAADIER